jgi:two-component system NtrC family response regulator
VKLLNPEAAGWLCAYTWPGNVRQLGNAVEMAVALSGDRQVLTPSDFPLSASRDPPPGTHTVAVLDDGLDDVNTVANFERSLLEQPLQKTGGNEKLRPRSSDSSGLPSRRRFGGSIRPRNGSHD